MILIILIILIIPLILFLLKKETFFAPSGIEPNAVISKKICCENNSLELCTPNANNTSITQEEKNELCKVHYHTSNHMNGPLSKGIY
jgi:hypothetical protein